MERSGRTRKLLILHYQTYPELQIQDIFKFLYQSSFGCEHLVSSPESVTDFIRREYETIRKDSRAVIEPLDGDYCRVPLSYMNQGLSETTLGKLFLFSAKKERNGKEELLHKLKIAGELVREGMLPFSPDEFDREAAEWEAGGFQAVRHSGRFRAAYAPSYRVIAKEYVPFLPFFAELDRRLLKGVVRAAIEGGSASGKTTLSKMLADIYGCTVFHMDDFFLRPEQRTKSRYAEVGGNVDRERFLSEVLLPLSKGEGINYRKFDCSLMELKEAETVIPKRLTVVEGAYSMHPELAKYYDFSIFLDISPDLQKERIIRRNSPEMAKRFFEEWIPLETVYFSQTGIKERCNMFVPIS